MTVAVDSTFDVVVWFRDRALNESEYLQPQKLQRLLFLAQAYYAVANGGERMMPSVFVADAMGPLDPNMYRAYENAPPLITHTPLPRAVVQFLDVIWRRFGHHSTDYLTRMLIDHPAFTEAMRKGKRSEITVEAMVTHFSRNKQEVERVIQPKVVRSHTGRTVEVRKWTPTTKPSR